MSCMILEFETKAGGLVVIEGSAVKYWEGEGLPTFEGDLEGLAEMFPTVMKELLAKGIVKRA